MKINDYLICLIAIIIGYLSAKYFTQYFGNGFRVGCQTDVAQAAPNSARCAENNCKLCLYSDNGCDPVYQPYCEEPEEGPAGEAGEAGIWCGDEEDEEGFIRPDFDEDYNEPLDFQEYDNMKNWHDEWHLQKCFTKCDNKYYTLEGVGHESCMDDCNHSEWASKDSLLLDDDEYYDDDEYNDDDEFDLPPVIGLRRSDSDE